jgi:hypothetical protein
MRWSFALTVVAWQPRSTLGSDGGAAGPECSLGEKGCEHGNFTDAIGVCFEDQLDARYPFFKRDPGQPPGDRLIVLEEQYWESHKLTTMLVAIVLKEFLGAEVWFNPVNNTMRDFHRIWLASGEPHHVAKVEGKPKMSAPWHWKNCTVNLCTSGGITSQTTCSASQKLVGNRCSMPPRYKETKNDQKTHGDGPVLQHWLNNSYIQGLSYVNMEVWEANKVMQKDFFFHNTDAHLREMVVKVAQQGHGREGWYLRRDLQEYAGEFYKNLVRGGQLHRPLVEASSGGIKCDDQFSRCRCNAPVGSNACPASSNTSKMWCPQGIGCVTDNDPMPDLVAAQEQLGVLHAMFDSAVGLNEEMVRNIEKRGSTKVAGLPLAIEFHQGAAFERMLREHYGNISGAQLVQDSAALANGSAAREGPSLFYYWEPGIEMFPELVDETGVPKVKRVFLPATGGGDCGQIGEGKGSYRCDFKVNRFLRLASEKLKSFPLALEIIREFELPADEDLDRCNRIEGTYQLRGKGPSRQYESSTGNRGV